MSMNYKIVSTDRGDWMIPLHEQSAYAGGDQVFMLYVMDENNSLQSLPNGKILTISDNGNYITKTGNYTASGQTGINVNFCYADDTVFYSTTWSARTDRLPSGYNITADINGNIYGYTTSGLWSVGDADEDISGLEPDAYITFVEGSTWHSFPYGEDSPIGNAYRELLNGADVDDYVPDDDPYNNPGEGDFDDGNSDTIGDPSLPGISAADTGFITLYNPSASNLKSLANYLWSDLFSLDTFKKLFSDPMQAILGLSILPIAIPTSGSREVRVGNIPTGVSLPVASGQFFSVDCGTITIKRQSPGTYLDFSPYTKVDLYLPFIGTHPLNVDECMGRSINVKYHVDILSGACTAFVKIGGSILYQFIGSCAISVPITGNDWTNAINGVMNIAGSIGSMIATGGATAPMAIGGIASTAVNNLKPDVEKSGAVSGSGGLMGVKRPYLIISRPNRNVAKNQNAYIGYPTYKTVKLKNIRGYNSIEDIHLEGIKGTQEELLEIERLLKEGVIL